MTFCVSHVYQKWLSLAYRHHSTGFCVVRPAWHMEEDVLTSLLPSQTAAMPTEREMSREKWDRQVASGEWLAVRGWWGLQQQMHSSCHLFWARQIRPHWLGRNDEERSWHGESRGRAHGADKASTYGRRREEILRTRWWHRGRVRDGRERAVTDVFPRVTATSATHFRLRFWGDAGSASHWLDKVRHVFSSRNRIFDGEKWRNGVTINQQVGNLGPRVGVML